TRVSGTWVGPMHIVPHTRHGYVRNFSSIRNSLFPILMMGSVTVLLAGVAAVATGVDPDPDDGVEAAPDARRS
ncbi:MAG: hypothetical protein ACREPL_13850, partial [Rhodanobacteraceae bacterium]